MYVFLILLHLLICFALVSVVLMQSGKGGGLAGGAFGGSAQTVFGGRGATDFLTRATMVLAAAFFLTSLGLAYLSMATGARPRSLIQSQAHKAAQTAPSRMPAGAPGAGGAGQAPATPQSPAPSGGR
ncbi:MAG TPA: preprotein translocase subunit SecG [Terriglobales bacterium]|nr:preprotein translocase subunit SecG [Terriglobales bacterium]